MAALARTNKGIHTAELVKRADLLIRAGKTDDAIPILEALKLIAELEVAVLKLKIKSARERLDKIRDPRLELLQKIDSSASRLHVVEGAVKRFSKNFQSGVRDPDGFRK